MTLNDVAVVFEFVVALVHEAPPLVEWRTAYPVGATGTCKKASSALLSKSDEKPKVLGVTVPEELPSHVAVLPFCVTVLPLMRQLVLGKKLGEASADDPFVTTRVPGQRAFAPISTSKKLWFL